MKFRPKSVRTVDSNRSRKIQLRLHRLSLNRRREQLKAEKAPALKRDGSDTHLTVKAKLLLNKNGNRTGIANRINPPSSEYMRKIRAMRKIYNRQMPVLQCSNCAFATSCPQFKAGFECAYLPYLNSHKVDNERDLMEAMRNLCEASLSRVHRQAMMETLTGGMPSLETSEAFNLAFMQLKTLHDKIMETDSVDVTLDTKDGTIIGQLFGNLENLVEQTTEAQAHPIDVPPIISVNADPVKMLSAPTEINRALIKEHTRDELEHITGNRRRKEKPQENSIKIGDVVL